MKRLDRIINSAIVCLTLLSAGIAVAQNQSHQLVWEEVPSGLAIGENAVFHLRVRGWNPSMIMPQESLLLPPVLQGFILEKLPVSLEEKSEGMALRLRLIPLEVKPFSLERRTFTHDGFTFEVPRLQIPVRVAAKTTASAEHTSSTESAYADSPESNPPLVFPSLETKTHEHLYQRYKTECDTIYATAKNLWERGYRANALATLRQNERDHPAGLLFTATRREAEYTLDITGTNDEEKQHFLSFVRGKTKTAVLKETELRNIPDMSGEIIGRFKEGQPVLVVSPAGIPEQPNKAMEQTWVRVITNDSVSAAGWVPEERIIVY
jgi:hypothetical protein